MILNTIKHFFKSNITDNSIGLSELNNIINLKKYSKFHILGSGSSINETNFKTINSNELTIGFNFWIYNSFIPDIYVFEIKPRDTSKFIFWCSLLAKRENELKDVIFLIKDSEIALELNTKLIKDYFPSRLRKNLYLTHDKALIGRNFFQVKIAYFLTKLLFKDYMIKYRGTLSYVFSIIPNNKEVSIYGIDFDSRPHFFNCKNYKTINLPLLKNETTLGTRLHRTVDSNFGPITIDLFIKFTSIKDNIKINHIKPGKIDLSRT
jgi:hypothetical protein